MPDRTDLVVMGVSGAGASPVGERPADARGPLYADAGGFHPSAGLLETTGFETTGLEAIGLEAIGGTPGESARGVSRDGQG